MFKYIHLLFIISSFSAASAESTSCSNELLMRRYTEAWQPLGLIKKTRTGSDYKFEPISDVTYTKLDESTKFQRENNSFEINRKPRDIFSGKVYENEIKVSATTKDLMGHDSNTFITINKTTCQPKQIRVKVGNNLIQIDQDSCKSILRTSSNTENTRSCEVQLSRYKIEKCNLYFSPPESVNSRGLKVIKRLSQEAQVNKQ